MARRLGRLAFGLVSLVLAIGLAIGGFVVARERGWLTPLGIESSSSNSQVMQAIERTQEVSLVSLGIQGLKEEERSRTIFGRNIPGTGEKVLLQYKFNAKLGINGADVKVTETGENTYLISVPNFIFIGYAQPTFKVAAEDGGALRWVTPDINRVAMVNEILNEAEQQTYLAANEDVLKEQTKLFYDTLLTSVDPAIVTTFEFAS